MLTFAEPLTVAEIRSVATRADITAVSTNATMRTSTWQRLDEELFARRSDIRLVVHGAEYDLSFAAALTHVRRLAVHPVWRPKAIESIAQLPKLELLSLHAFFLESFDFLNGFDPRSLRSLSLHQTKSKKPSLAPLARFKNLRKLHVEFQSKDIEVLAELRALEEVTFRSVTTGDLEFLRPLPRLRSVDLKRGAIEDLSALAAKETVRYLELWQVRGVVDVDIAAQLPGLQHLFLQSLSKVRRLPSFRRNTALRRIHLQNMKALKDVATLATAPALEELVIYEGMTMQPEMFAPVLASRSLDRALGGFGSRTKNERFRAIAQRHGVGEVTGPFRFRRTRSGRS